MRRIWRLAAALCVVGSLCLVLPRTALSSHAAATRHASLVLDWYPNSDHGGLFTAIRQGYFAQRHISLSAYVPSDTSAQIPLTAAGKADFAITYEADLLSSQVKRIPVQSVMCIVQHPLNTIMTLKSSGIRRPHDLIGKTIGEAGAPSDNAIISAVMAHDRASIKQAHLVNVSYNLLTALLAHRVEAVVGVYWTWEALQAADKGYPVNVMRVERWGVPNYCELVLIANARLIRTNPALVRDTVQALQRGYAFAGKHPMAAWAALHARDKTLDRRLVVRSLALLGPAISDAPTLGYQDPGQWRRYALWLRRTKVLSAPIQPQGSYTNRFLAPRIR